MLTRLSCASLLLLLSLANLVACAPRRISGDLGRSEMCLTSENGRIALNEQRAEVKQAVQALSQIGSDGSYAVAGDRRGELGKHSSDRQKVFLDSVCKEYRDAPLVADRKIRTISELIRVAPGPQRYDPAKTVWQQLTGEGYERLVFLMQAVSIFKTSGISSTRDVKLAEYFSECDFRFILEKYLVPKKTIREEADYLRFVMERKAYAERAVEEKRCLPGEDEQLVLFRGEGILWPTSAEATAMRAVGSYYQNGCNRRFQKSAGIAEEECAQFRSEPYRTRMEFALAAARSLIAFSSTAQDVLSDLEKHFLLVDDQDGDSLPDGFSFDKNKVAGSELWRLFQNFSVAYMRSQWATFEQNRRDLKARLDEALKKAPEGTTLFRSGQADTDLKKLSPEERLRVFAVLLGRHVDFYKMGYYFPVTGLTTLYFSPLVSATPYISEAHKFSFKSYSLGGPREAKMSWLQIFHIRRDELFTGEKVMAGALPDLKNDWMDEVSLTAGKPLKENGSTDKIGMPGGSQFAALLWLGDLNPSDALLDYAQYFKFHK